jgi:hypothetical protein
MIRAWILVLSLGLAYATNVAAAEDGSYQNYDAIVSELKASADEPLPPRVDTRWDDVALHGGFGFATALVNVYAPEGIGAHGILKGFEAHCGMNLFSTRVRAEGTFRNFSDESINAGLRVDLREFELALIFLPNLNAGNALRMGAGLTARNMTLSSATFSHQTTTPDSSVILGFEHKISKQVSLGPDFAYRSALIGDTFDRYSWDAAFRLNATF